MKTTTQLAYQPAPGPAVNHRHHGFKPKALTAAIATCFAAVTLANPAAPQVAAGAATFTRQGNSLVVTNTDKTIINWGSFSIGAGELTRFVQSGAGSSVLNRVTGNAPSEILGQLLSNGKVFVINPNGVAIGGGARIDTAGFIASSLGMSDADFTSGKLRFVATGPGATVSNDGIIQGNGALVALVGPRVSNAGNITSLGGNVVLAAGRDVELLDALSPHIKVRFAPGTTDAQLSQVLHSGVLSVAAPDVGNAVGASVQAGRVVLHSAGDVQVSGSLAAQNTTGVGGPIDVLGQNIVVTPQAVLDASGQTGGRVVVLAQNDAVAQGSYLARGTTGAGGFIETSGLRTLDVSGANVSASGSTPGTWLLDPFDIEVVAAPSAPVNITQAGGSSLTTFSPIGNDSRILNTQIEAALNAGTSVTLDTAGGGGGTQPGDITVSAPINSTGTPATVATLRLNANNNINVTADITTVGPVRLTAFGGIQFTGATLSASSVNLSAGAGGVLRSGTQANDVVVTGMLINDVMAIGSTGSVGTQAEPLRFSSPTDRQSWGVNTFLAAPTLGNIHLQPTQANFRIDGPAQLTTNSSPQLVTINHLAGASGSVSLNDDISADDNFIISTQGAYISNYGGPSGTRPSVLAGRTISVTADRFESPFDSIGTFFNTSASLSEILCVRHNMSKRKSMYAKQEETSRTSGPQSGVAAHS